MIRNAATRRIFRLLEYLQDGQLHRLDDLADAFQVTTRTIRRDIDVLVDAEFAIDSDLIPNERGRDVTAYQLLSPEAVRLLLSRRVA